MFKIALLLIILSSWQISASANTVSYSMSQSIRYQNSTNYIKQDYKKVKSQDVNLGIEVNAAPNLTFSGNLKSSKPDYSSYLISDSNNQDHKLSDIENNDYQYEHFLDGTLTYQKGNNALNFSLFGNINSSPFLQRGGKLSYYRELFKKTTRLGMGHTYFKQNNPESYFTDTQLQFRKRATRIYGQQTFLSVEQVLNAHWKTRLKTFTGKRKNERPRHYGAELANNVAITDQLFVGLKLKHVKEDRDRELLDERGHFDSSLALGHITFEPIFDLLVNLSYGVGKERELEPLTGRLVQVGSDIYGVGLNYLLDQFKLEFKGKYTETNTEANDYSVSGGITWEF